MKRLGLIIGLIMALIMTGCSTDTYETYKSAVDKTELVKRGQEEIQIDIEMDFDYKDLSEEDLKKVRGMEHLSMKGYFRFDKEKDQVAADMNLNFGGVGMDSELYIDGEEIWLKLNSLGKYMALHDVDIENDITFSDEQFERIGQLWETYVDEENLYEGEAILVETPMGNVKSTRFYVQMDPDQMKAFFSEMMILLEEEGLIDLQGESMDMDNVIINEMYVESFIDIDNYVVEETIVCDVNFLDNDFEGLKFTMRTLLYDIEEDQNIEIPKIDEANLLTLDELEEDAESIFDFNWED